MNEELHDENCIQMPLPSEIMYRIFSYLTYDDISKLRLVCKQFNSLASSSLNSGFARVQTLHTQCLKQIKDSLPRRESERRKHSLYPRHETLQGLDTRISLLRMTYSKYIWSNLCCFIPGKVLDEIYSVLHKMKTSSQLPPTASLLQEVRDISSMAMEHFDEFIAPSLVHLMQESPDGGSPCHFSSSPLSKALKIPLPNLDPWPGSSPNISSTFSSPSVVSPSKFCKVHVHTLLRKERANKRMFKKMIISQRKQIRGMKLKMSKSNKHVMLLRLILRKHRKSMEEVQMQITELTTQLHTLQGLLSLRETCDTSQITLSHQQMSKNMEKTHAIVSSASSSTGTHETLKRKHEDTFSKQTETVFCEDDKHHAKISKHV